MVPVLRTNQKYGPTEWVNYSQSPIRIFPRVIAKADESVSPRTILEYIAYEGKEDLWVAKSESTLKRSGKRDRRTCERPGLRSLQTGWIGTSWSISLALWIAVSGQNKNKWAYLFSVDGQQKIFSSRNRVRSCSSTPFRTASTFGGGFSGTWELKLIRNQEN